MKKTLLTLTAITVAVGALAQGTVVFNNRVTGTIVSQIRAPELGSAAGEQKYGNQASDFPAGTTVFTGALLTGNGWTATLWSATGAGAAEGLLVQSPNTTTFRTGAAAGFLAGITATLANVAADAPVATLQVRVYPTSYGSWANALAAYNAADLNAVIGKSVLFNVNQIGGQVNTPANLVGLTSFSLMAPIPEPSSMALAGLGAASLLIFRRRK